MRQSQAEPVRTLQWDRDRDVVVDASVLCAHR